MTDILRIIRSLVNLVAIMINLCFWGNNKSTNDKNNVFNGFLSVYTILNDPECAEKFIIYSCNILLLILIYFR